MNADETLITTARRQHFLLARSDVTRLGISSRQWTRRVDRGEWVEVCTDVWRHALTTESWELRARAGLTYLGDDAALFGLTSAAWWGLDVPAPAVVEFVVPRDRRRLKNDLVIHTSAQWDPRDLLRHRGLRATTVTRTILDLAGTRTAARVVENAIDSGVRHRFTSVPTLITRMNELSGPGHRGVPLVRELVLDSGGESRLERRFLRLVRRHRLPRPICQVVHREDGRVMRVDFQFEREGIVVEVSGRVGHASDRDRQRDARRRNELQRKGLVVLEFTTGDVVDDEPYVVATLREHLAIRSCRPFTTTTVL